MPHELDLILTLTGGRTATLAPGFITPNYGSRPSSATGWPAFSRVRSAGFAANQNTAAQSAEIGVIRLRFGAGRPFPRKYPAVQPFHIVPFTA